MRYIFSIIALAMLLSSCEQAPTGTTVKGTLSGASSLQVYLDAVKTGDQTAILQKVQADANGSFSMNFPEGLDEGMYRLKIGRQEVDLVFDGNEKVVEVSGDLEQMKKYGVDITGSAPTAVMTNTMQALFARQFKLEDIGNFIDTTKNAYVAALITMKAVPMRGELLDTHKKVLNKLALAYPAAPLTTTYEQAVTQMEQAYIAQKASEKIKEGEIAPDIKLTDPNGKTYALSDLRGQVVLLDFWASWCGPCRRANPNVVDLYNRYKNKGFTVFSVSLDGPRRTQGLNQAQLQEQFDRSKEKWIAAIEKDNLTWPYHVSDLKYWSAAPAQTYGVRSIPKTFLIDKEGKIVKTGVNPMSGIRQLEEDIKSLL
ncbi:MAG: TlpA disulfide reductase family protein [Bacteroidota bacterium]